MPPADSVGDRTTLSLTPPTFTHACGKLTLELRWNIDPGMGGNGRGCQVSEVWLIKAR